MLSRHAQPLLNSLLKHFPCVALLGARQCGKTTLIRQLPLDWQFFDMENASDRAQVMADPDLFFRLYPQGVVIDEAQLVPEIFPALRVAIDNDRSARGRFVLSGSSSPQLSHRIAESLAGRVALLEMSPFTPAEALQLPASPLFGLIAQGADIEQLIEAALPRIALPDLIQQWFCGGYPEPWTRKDTLFQNLWQRNYWDTYLLRDIGALFPNLNRDRFRQFAQLLAHLSGTILNNADIARTLAVSEPTVRDWLDIADGTFIWRHVPAWDRSPHKQLTRHAKGYMRDSGVLLRQLRVADPEMLLSHPLLGRWWEGHVTETLLRSFANLGAQVQPRHFRTRGGAEIDLILDGEFGVVPVEIKVASHAEPRDLRHLAQFVADHGCAYGLVINNDDRPRRLGNKLVSLPMACL